MSLFQNLIETYERCSEAIGIISIDQDGNINEKKTLLPIYHTTFKSEVYIIISENGKLISATRDKKETTIIIPCTENSLGRANQIAAHPLCDYLDYVGGLNEKKLNVYLEGLSAWKKDDFVLNAIYEYVFRGTVILDLENLLIFKESEYIVLPENNGKKELDIEKVRKIGLRFAVQINGELINVWESKELRNEWIEYINNNATRGESYFDYLSGKMVNIVASQHPKNINSITGNAKLISCNDSSGFTFRGRFAVQNDAIILDYTQSQKMHQMLRWLIANYGYKVDSQVVITWAVDSNTEVKEKAQNNSFELFINMRKVKTESDSLLNASKEVYSDYAKKLNKLFDGYGQTENVKKHSRKICIAIFDAATTGRMGLVFYQEFPEETYLENIIKWHSDTSYFLTSWKKLNDENGNEKNIPIHYIGAPSYDDIIFAVFGKSHGDKSYNILKKKIRKQLFESMFGNFTLPKSMVEMAVLRASNPLSFDDSKGVFNKEYWEKSINITCALTRKYYKQKKEEIKLELDEKRTDRDYLFGRLLAVADKLEESALYHSGVKRPTNAVKLMSSFQVKPYSTWGQLFTQLIPYKNQLNGAGYYQSLIDNIMVLFKEGDYEKNRPLSPLYLLGYSAQSRFMIGNNKNNKKMEVEENVNITE